MLTIKFPKNKSDLGGSQNPLTDDIMFVQTTHKEQRTMTRKELQTALRQFRDQGLTTIKLNAKNSELQDEYNRLTTQNEPETTIEPETPETPGSFRDIICPLHRYNRPKAQGFSTVKPEKRYDQLTHDEWLNDTLAFLDDEVTCEYDYIAA